MELYRSLLLLPALLVVLAALLIWPALQWGLHSLTRLIEDLTRRPGPAADFAPADVALAPREFQPVLAAFNHLLSRLEKSTSSIQRFAADASHQLRTPLSVLAANLELLADSSQDRTPQERRLIEDSRDAVTGMTRLVAQLLSTARADASRIDSTADLGRAVRRACQTARERQGFSAQALRIRMPVEPVIVRGAEELIAEQVLNLIDNAFHHGVLPVIVYVATQGDRSSITVWDHGEGVEEVALPRLVDRFFRAHPSRGSGSGLGLAIVQTLAIAQGAQFSLANRLHGRSGLVARLVFSSTRPEA